MLLQKQYYIGVMSGTSLDAIDCALVEFDSKNKFALVHHYSHVLTQKIRNSLFSLTQPQVNEINLLAKLDVQLGELIAQSCNELIKQAQIDPKQVTAIGSHGQTIRHFPQGSFRTTIQIGDANIICEQTGIVTIADFRRRDMAAGGQGAPLVPPFHATAFQHQSIARCIVNVGGIANISCLPALSDKNNTVIGYDTGPGNGLMDLWCKTKFNCQYDKNGEKAASGQVINTLLQQMLADPYFCLKRPKSTGREYFGEQWLNSQNLEKTYPNLGKARHNQEQIKLDILSTLTELTAITIAREIKQSMESCAEVLLCGGGSYNKHLMQRLKYHLDDKLVITTDEFGIPSQWIESMAFAWLARQTYLGLCGNLTSVTGAKHEVILGAIYQP